MPITPPKFFEPRRAAALALAALALTDPAAHAQSGGQTQTPAFSWSGSAAVVSDYRFRGFSLSNRDPALQGSFGVSHKSGFYAAIWGSTIEQFGGSEFELDVYGGYTNSVGGLTYNVGFYNYLYPGSDGNSLDYREVYGSLSGNAGPVSLTVGSNYAWDQDSIGSQDNIYVYTSGSVPLGQTPVTLSATLGYEDGAFGNDKVNWTLGANYTFANNYAVSLQYVDTANGGGGNLTEAGVVASLSASF